MISRLGRAKSDRRAFLAASVAGAATQLPGRSHAAARYHRFDRGAYDRYISLMNAGDLRFAEYYADDIKFIMNIRGRASVLDFYARQRSYVTETLKVLFFCSDAEGAAAEVLSELRCIMDCEDTAIFGGPLKAGQVQRTRGCLLYVLDAQGIITEIKGPPPEVLQPWRIEAG